MADLENLRLIRDSAVAIASRDLRRVRALRFTEPGWDPAVLREIGAMGWIGLRVPEAAGGAGLGMAELCVVMEECGTALTPEPLLPCATAARLHPDPALLAGERVIVPAWQERPDALGAMPDTVFRDGVVTGRKLFVPAAAGADAFLVTTRDGLALVERAATGVSLETARLQDGGHVATVDFAGASGTALSGDPAEALEEATLATAALLLGVMGRAFALTLDYLRTRQQFGKPIGSFQSLQHRAADLKLQLELTRASVESAAATLDAESPRAVRQAAVSRAKARAATAGMLVTRQAIQMHGGVGYTDEYDIGLYLRRAMVLSNAFGSAAAHRARFARLAPEDED